jgi:hypothetical protein
VVGAVDDVTIYNRTIAVDEVKRLAARSATQTTAPNTIAANRYLPIMRLLLVIDTAQFHRPGAAIDLLDHHPDLLDHRR